MTRAGGKTETRAGDQTEAESECGPWGWRPGRHGAWLSRPGWDRGQAFSWGSGHADSFSVLSIFPSLSPSLFLPFFSFFLYLFHEFLTALLNYHLHTIQFTLYVLIHPVHFNLIYLFANK